MNLASIEDAAKIIRQGGVIAYPTESCYGLGCDPANKSAIRRILRMKSRHQCKGLIVISDHISRLRHLVRCLPDDYKNEIIASWPGPYTWLLPVQSGVSEWLKGNHDTIAVRVTAHRYARLLCQNAEMAVVSTSANRASKKPLRTAKAVELEFGDELDAIMHGRIGSKSSPTSIRSAITGKINRI